MEYIIIIFKLLGWKHVKWRVLVQRVVSFFVAGETWAFALKHRSLVLYEETKTMHPVHRNRRSGCSSLPSGTGQENQVLAWRWQKLVRGGLLPWSQRMMMTWRYCQTSRRNSSLQTWVCIDWQFPHAVCCEYFPHIPSLADGAYYLVVFFH